MWPMFYEYYEDEECYRLEDQYLFGPEILFAPIMEEGQTQRSVYLPEDRWVSVIDRKVYEGKQGLSVRADTVIGKICRKMEWVSEKNKNKIPYRINE